MYSWTIYRVDHVQSGPCREDHVPRSHGGCIHVYALCCSQEKRCLHVSHVILLSQHIMLLASHVCYDAIPLLNTVPSPPMPKRVI